MCGIVGAIANREVSKILLNGLFSLEYRGYDSAGMALLNSDNNKTFYLQKCIGKVCNLQKEIIAKNLHGTLGIAHTRWATHGKASLNNAHPHVSENLVLVHNGIIENYKELKEKLIEKGYNFVSSTDTEVLVHLINYYFKKTQSLKEALQKSLSKVSGSYAICLFDKDNVSELWCAKKGSPLVLGIGIDEMFVASDIVALASVTSNFIYLDDGEIAKLNKDNYQIFDLQGQKVTKEVSKTNIDSLSISKNGYNHFMQKEIYEQPLALFKTYENLLNEDNVKDEAFLNFNKEDFLKIANIKIVACGTSYHAALIGKYYLEKYVKIPVDVEIASEFRYRDIVVAKNTLFITISQSGETADTIAALQKAKALNYFKSLCICNVANSTLVRESDFSFITKAGVEIGVASTKAFTTQILALVLLTIKLSSEKQSCSRNDITKLINDVKNVVPAVKQALLLDEKIKEIAANFVNKDHALFLGRNLMFPLALEGSLKLKEISYIHAEGYAAGELKHGPIALIDKNMPVIVVAPDDNLFEKLSSNIEEVKARGAKVFIISNKKLDTNKNEHLIYLDFKDSTLNAIIFAIPLQLLAYHVALIKGTDVDKPRNLAKSVTVE